MQKRYLLSGQELIDIIAAHFQPERVKRVQITQLANGQITADVIIATQLQPPAEGSPAVTASPQVIEGEPLPGSSQTPPEKPKPPEIEVIKEGHTAPVARPAEAEVT